MSAGRDRLRLWLTLGGLWLSGCVDNPYVIGRLREDAGGGADAEVDAEMDGAGPLDPCVNHPGALACSGFEVAGLSDWPEPTVVGSADVSRSTERARSGSGSLHAVSTGADSTAVVAQEFETRADGTLHLRVWLYVPADVPTETLNLFFLGDDPNPSDAPAAAFLGMDLNIEDGAVQLYSPQNSPDRVTGSVPIPRDRWFCMRGEFVLGDAGAVTIFVDDEVALEADPHDTLPDAGVHLLRAGVDWSSGQAAPLEVFLDDLVLSDTRVRCSDP